MRERVGHQSGTRPYKDDFKSLYQLLLTKLTNNLRKRFPLLITLQPCSLPS